MSDLGVFGQYNKLAVQLIKKASKEDIVECAWLLALNVVYYKEKFGDVSIDAAFPQNGSSSFSQEQLKMMESGMKVLVGQLKSVAAERTELAI